MTDLNKIPCSSIRGGYSDFWRKVRIGIAVAIAGLVALVWWVVS